MKLHWLLVCLPSVLGFVAVRSAPPMRTLPMAYPPGGPIPPGGGVAIDPGVKLVLCILIDFVGIATFAAPGVGELADVGWAPISALLVNYLFGNGVFTTLALVEELLPGFDIIPTATIAWAFEQYSNNDGPPDDFEKEKRTATNNTKSRDDIRDGAIDTMMKKLIGVLVVVLLLPSTAFEYDLTEFEMAIVPRWLELFSVDYERGIFSLEPGGPPDLYGTLDAIHILFACGHILNNTWASTINSYQEKMTGNYRLSPNAPGRQPYHSAALATATLELLGQRPAYSNRGFENTLRENLTRVFDPLYESACWSKKIRGNNIHECGQIIGSYPVVLFDNEDFFRWWTEWLLEKTHRTLGVLCPVSNDLYARIQCVGGSMPTYGVALGGGSKLPFPGNSLHFAIETQQDSNGTWSDHKNLQKLMGSLTLDGIVLATRSALQLKSQSALDSARISCKTMLGIVVPQLTNATLIFHDSLYAATSHNLPNVVAAVAQCAQTFPDLVKTTRPWSCCARYV